MIQKIFKLFLDQGGEFIQANIKSLEQSKVNETIIKLENIFKTKF